MGTVRDKNLGWLRKRIFLPVTGFPGYQVDILATGGQAAGVALQITPDSAAAVIGKTTATSFNALGATAAIDQNARLRAIANGNPRVVQVVGLNLAALLLVNANDGVLYTGMVPYDIDPSKELGVRPIWISNAAAVGARSITFAATYGFGTITPATTSNAPSAGSALADPATVLDTTITVDTPVGTNLAFQRGPRGVVNATTLLLLGPNIFWWSWKILMTAFNAAFVENKYLLGIEIDYNLRKTFGPGRLTSSKVLSSPFLLSTRPEQE